MPIYEYQSVDPKKGCPRCRDPFEILQKAADTPLKHCPECGTPVKKIISRCFGLAVETPEAVKQTEKKIREYEQAGMWSHAAELADTQAEKTKDKTLKSRALEDYRKAGHPVDSLTPE